MFSKGQLVKYRVDKGWYFPSFHTKKNEAWKFECIGVLLGEKLLTNKNLNSYSVCTVYWSDMKIRKHFLIELDPINEKV